MKVLLIMRKYFLNRELSITIFDSRNLPKKGFNRNMGKKSLYFTRFTFAWETQFIAPTGYLPIFRHFWGSLWRRLGGTCIRQRAPQPKRAPAAQWRPGHRSGLQKVGDPFTVFERPATEKNPRKLFEVDASSRSGGAFGGFQMVIFFRWGFDMLCP